MSGHNKWSKIKHKKAATDAKKSAQFSKVARLIGAESKAVKGDINSPSLKTLIDKAKALNMPKDNIDRAIQKGVHSGAESLEKVVYEAYGPAGVALIIEGITDNRNRSAQEVKRALSKLSFSIATPGSALWAFDKKDGEFIPTSSVSLTEEEDQVLSLLLDALDDLDDVTAVYTNAT